MGGRSSGGGGSSSTVDYPEYQKVIQANWLGGGRYDDASSMATLTAGNSISELINLAIGNSPYETAIAYDPDTQVNRIITASTEYLPYLREQIIAYLTYLDEMITTFSASYDISNYTSDTALDDLETRIIAAELGGDGADEYKADGSLNQLYPVENDFDDAVKPGLYRMDNSLDEALFYVKSLDTTEQVERELAGFDSYMREINAVHSSAFVLGRQIVAAGLLATKAQMRTELAQAKDRKAYQLAQLSLEKQRILAELRAGRARALDEKARAVFQQGQDVEKYRLAAFQDLARMMTDKQKAIAALNYEKDKTVLSTEMGVHQQIYPTVAQGVSDNVKMKMDARRMAIIAYSEEAQENLRIDTKDAMWSIDIFQGAANVMASISGGTVTTPEDSPGGKQSALAGGLSGAAAGAMIGAQTGNPYGVAIGAVVGGIGGALMS